MTTIERPTARRDDLHALHDARMRAWSAILLGAVLLQVLLGAANVSWLDIPADGEPESSSSPRWLLEAHVWFGTALAIAAVVALVFAVRSRDRPWILVTSVGLVGLVVALAAGDRFLRSHGEAEAASMAMACGAVLALAAYAAGVARRRSS